MKEILDSTHKVTMIRDIIRESSDESVAKSEAGEKRNFEKEVLPMGSTEEVEEKSGDKTPPKKCEKATEDQKKKKIARQREGWRMVWEGGGIQPQYTENVRKKKTPKRRITTKNKEEGRNKEESSSRFFLQRWLSGTTKQTLTWQAVRVMVWLGLESILTHMHCSF